MTEREKMLSAYLDAAREARRTAHEWRRLNQNALESAKAFGRAHYYLWQVRMWRAK